MVEPIWPKAVIFDLDGTLVDTAPDIASSINDVLRADGLEPFSLIEGGGIHRQWHHPARRSRL